MHLVMNLFIFWDFGGEIETAAASFFAILVLALAVASNAGQAAELQVRSDSRRSAASRASPIGCSATCS
jgi:membrane associated rhomboid family serine protease